MPEQEPPAPRHGRPLPQGVDRHVGARLRERRVALGLSQRALAGMVGITLQQQHKYEHGASRLAAGRLYAFARALEVGVEYFFEDLDRDGRTVAGQRRLLELARGFAALPPAHQELLAALARALAGTDAG